MKKAALTVLGVLLGVSAIAATIGAVVGGSSSAASALSSPIHIAGTGGQGVNIRPTPDTSQPPAGWMPEGASPDFHCFTYGQQVGNVNVWFDVTYNNKTGYYASYYDDSHYSSAADLEARYGIPKCGTSQPAPPAPAAVAASAPVSTSGGPVINGIPLGTAQNGRHPWGLCSVQDFKGGPDGWVIVSYTNGTHVTRNGMLFGLFDNGGMPAMGCPLNDEHPYADGVRQDFTGGSLFWRTGMDHAQRLNSITDAAAVWALNQLGQPIYAMECLGFAVTGYQVEGHPLTDGPYGESITAQDWWVDAPAADHSPGTDAPRGAIYIWSTYAGGQGHAAISLGGGWAVSTEFYGTSTIHLIHVADYPTYFEGWLAPTW